MSGELRVLLNVRSSRGRDGTSQLVGRFRGQFHGRICDGPSVRARHNAVGSTRRASELRPLRWLFTGLERAARERRSRRGLGNVRQVQGSRRGRQLTGKKDEDEVNFRNQTCHTLFEYELWYLSSSEVGRLRIASRTSFRIMSSRKEGCHLLCIS